MISYFITLVSNKFKMKTMHKILTISIFIVFVVIGFNGLTMAATTPSLGTADRFAILSSTLSITTIATVDWDVGYTTLSNPWLNLIGWTIFIPSPPQAWLDQASALSNLNGQTCTFTFAPGSVDLATDTTHGTIWIYTSGIYCIDGAASIGSAGITLSGAWTFIFRTIGISNALTTVDNSIVRLTGGTSACDVFWTPTAATTLGANTTFIGTVIDDAGITVGSTTSWIGRALAYAETVTINSATITNICGGAAGTGTLNVIKNVVGGAAIPADFRIYVNLSGSVVGSWLGTGWLGMPYLLTAGTYTVSEDLTGSYTQTLSADCVNVTLLSGDNKTCTITNTYIPAGTGTLRVIKNVVGGTAIPTDFRLYVNRSGSVVGSWLGTGWLGTPYLLAAGTYTVSEDSNWSYTQSLSADCVNVVLLSGDNKTCTITNTYIQPSGGGGGWVTLTKDDCPEGDYSDSYYDNTCGIAPVIITGSINTGSEDIITPIITPGLPQTWAITQSNNIPWNIVILASILMLVSTSIVVASRKI